MAVERNAESRLTLANNQFPREILQLIQRRWLIMGESDVTGVQCQ
jgi:hypothetical protein